MNNDSDRKKLEELNMRIEKAQEAADPISKTKDRDVAVQSRQAIRMIRIGSDFLAVIVVFGGIGWFLDGQLDTQPWLMLGLLIVGFITGFWMLVRVLFRKRPETEDKE